MRWLSRYMAAPFATIVDDFDGTPDGKIPQAELDQSIDAGRSWRAS